MLEILNVWTNSNGIYLYSVSYDKYIDIGENLAVVGD